MKIYAAGWALQSPALNSFKKFLRLNAITIEGIVYPKKVPDDLDGIPILDFDSIRSAILPGDVVLECHRPGVTDLRLSVQLKEFFDSLNIQTMGVSDFIISLINKDHENELKFPVPGLTSQNIKDLWSEKPFSFIDDSFADLESYAQGKQLDVIARTADWDQMLDFDQDDTPDNTLFNVIKDLYVRDICQSFCILDTPQPFLNALLKLKTQYPEADLPVEIIEAAVTDIGVNWEFYRRSLNLNIQTAENVKKVTYLAGSMDAIGHMLQHNLINAIFFMQGSILDLRKLKRTLGTSPHRILLRQPDTMPAHLIAGLLT